ncbi:hypothetical protein NX059_012554 [Plenodomus lindquistii]|nr:hypothetical protein NX059_012554 [Plenodomus lindquistii]
MTYYNFLLRNRPVLAYSKCNAQDPLYLLLDVTYDDSAAQCTFSLQDEARTFILCYNADNFVSGPLTLHPALIPLPQLRLDQIARHGNAQIYTLVLGLKQPCIVWCSLSGIKTFNERLLNLAKATEVDILFDYNWLHRDKQAHFQRVIEHPEQFSGVPLDRHYSKLYKCVDWTVFKTGHDEAQADADATTEDDEPPPVYTEARVKRPFRSSNSSNSSASGSPPAKRALLSLLEVEHGSPTEKGSTWAPSHKPSPFPTVTSPKSSPLVAPNADIHSIAASSPKTPCSPILRAPNTPHDVKHAGDGVSPSRVRVLVSKEPGCLMIRLVNASTPLRPSQSPEVSQDLDAPPTTANPISDVTFLEHLARKIEAKLGIMCEDTLYEADDMRKEADMEFREMLEEERLHLGIDKEDAAYEFERIKHEKLAAFEEQCNDLSEYGQERLGHITDDALDDAKQRVDQLAHEAIINFKQAIRDPATEREELNKLREDLNREKKQLRRDKKDLRKERQDLSKERDDLRKERKALRRDRRRFESGMTRVVEESARGWRENTTATSPG